MFAGQLAANKMMTEENKSRTYSVSELAKELGITARAIRFYEDKGLIRPRRVGANRSFDYRDKGRLTLITRLRRLGFSLEVIGEYLSLYKTDKDGLTQLKTGYCQAQQRIVQLEQQCEDLKKLLEETYALREEIVRLLAERNFAVEDLGA